MISFTRRSKIIALAVVLLLMSNMVRAQYVEEFSTEPETFVKELDKMLKATKRDDCKKTSDKFETAFPTFDASQKEHIIAIANIMAKRKMRAFPFFKDYLDVLMMYKNNDRAEEQWDGWHESLKSVLENAKKGSSKDYQAYIGFTKALFGKNSLIVSKAKTWVADFYTYELGYEDGQPYMYTPNCDLFAYTRGDTITINNTAGYFYPLTKEWEGEAGTVYWNRASLDSTDVYATFGEYKMDLSKSNYEIDSVTFFYKSFFGETPLHGKLVDKLVVDNKKSTTSYPRFDSYEERLVIENLAERVTYTGGFVVQGVKIIGRGSKENKAQMIFMKENDSTAVVVNSNRFLIRIGDVVRSSDAEVTIYVKEDSIYHPGLNLTFKIPSRELTLMRGKVATSKTTFFNSFHQVEMDAEGIVWSIDTPELTIDHFLGKGETPVIFESSNYFEKNRLDKYQNIMDYNPISVIIKYSEDHGSREMYAENVALKMGSKYTVETIERLLYLLVAEGFIYYDNQTQIITVREKTFHYVFANAELKDYDIIKIESKTMAPSAKLDLSNYNMNMEGVKRVVVSDSQYVLWYPSNRLLRLKKNRDMEFGGTVFAGRMDFNGDGFSFIYDAFRLNLSKIDAFQINIPGKELDHMGKPILIPVITKISNLTGSILIDNPENKSGLKKKEFPEYPIFESLEPSYAYYNGRSILKGVYSKQRFFFELDPFLLDSLNTFKPSGVYFDGTMVTAGIFPDFREQLRIQKHDKSLGFQIETEAGGKPVYGGKGTYSDSIFLSHDGFLGHGTLSYLSSHQFSNDITFYPDSLNSNSDSFYVEEATLNGVEFPNVYNTHVYTHWAPYKDSMTIKMKKSKFGMYDNQSALVGNLTLTPGGLIGAGIMEFEGANLLISNEFKFKKHEFDADTAELNFKAVDPTKIGFRAPNVNAHINFNKREGKFVSNLDHISIEFPYNEYKTSINEFNWYMDDKILDFLGDDNTYFMSTHPDQD